MGLFITNRFFTSVFAIAMFVAAITWAEETPADYLHQKILFLMRSSNTEQAIELYRELKNKNQTHDFELLQQMGLILLDQGYRSKDPELQLLSLLGAGISARDEAFYIIESGLNSRIPQLQLASLSIAGKLHSDQALEALQKLMGSNFAILRFEAVLVLAKNKHPKAAAQLESLLYKVPPEALPLFPPLLVLIEDSHSTRILKKLMSHHNLDVRLACLLCAAKNRRDDLLPNIRTMATHRQPAQQEACAYAFGELKDEQSADKLLEFSKSPHDAVKLSALKALYSLGRNECRYSIEEMARRGDLFAIYALKDIEGSEDLLASLCRSTSSHVRINAALALLQRRDAKSLPILEDLFFKGEKDLEFAETLSGGGSLAAWKAVPSSKHNVKETNVIARSQELRELALVKAAELPEKDFLPLARRLFKMRQDHLIPLLTRLLENLNTEGSIALLKEERQRLGAPLIRNYCNLALYKTRLEGPWKKDLIHWLIHQKDTDMINLAEAQAEENQRDPFTLNRQEAAKFLTDAFEAVAQQQQDKGIEIILNAIQYGNQKNKYALAGLLIRSAQ